MPTETVMGPGPPPIPFVPGTSPLLPTSLPLPDVGMIGGTNSSRFTTYEWVIDRHDKCETKT